MIKRPEPLNREVYLPPGVTKILQPDVDYIQPEELSYMHAVMGTRVQVWDLLVSAQDVYRLWHEKGQPHFDMRNAQSRGYGDEVTNEALRRFVLADLEPERKRTAERNEQVLQRQRRDAIPVMERMGPGDWEELL